MEIGKKLLSFEAVTMIVLILVGSAVVFRGAAQRQREVLLAEDIQQLGRIFDRIHQTCHILGFDHQKSYVDFLNVRSFVGSEVGPMNLMYPERWEGPYVQDNPTIRETLYQVVRTKQGYFLMPGDGVRLANGKVVGVDIPTTERADVEVMMRDPQQLMVHGKPLAWRISTGRDVVEEAPQPTTTLVSLRRLFGD